MQEFYQLSGVVAINSALTGIILSVSGFLFSQHRPELSAWGMHRCGLLENVG